MNLRHRPAIALLCLPLLLTGCSEDDEEPEAKPPATSAAVTTPSGTASAEAWEEPGVEGAEAFARHWMTVFNEAKRTGDTELLEQLSDRSCTSCENFVSTISEIYTNGGRIESNGWRILNLVPTEGDKKVFVAIRVKQTPELVYRKAGGDPERFPGGPLTLSATVKRAGSGWQMERLDLLE